MAGFGRVIYGTSIPFIMQQGQNQIAIRATAVAKAIPFHNVTVIGGVLATETNKLYRGKRSLEHNHAHFHEPDRVPEWALRLYQPSSSSQDSPPLTADAAFACRDAGETLAFLPAMRLLAAEGWDVLGLALTSNAARILHDAQGIRVATLQDLGVHRTDLPRDETLSVPQLHTVRESLHVTRRFVTGLVSAVQLQLAESWLDPKEAAEGLEVLGYDDGFALWRNDTDAARFLRSSPLGLMVTSQIIAEEAAKVRYGGVGNHLNVSVVGQPTLAAWNATARDIPAAIQLRRRLGLEQDLPVWAFFGGYGGASYNASVGVLADAIVSGGVLKSFHIVITPHPGQGKAGGVEEDILRRRGVAVRWATAGPSPGQHHLLVRDPAAVVIVEATLANSSSIAAIANATASVDSTCGLQSLAIGKPALYIDHAGNFSDVATAEGLIPEAQTPRQVLNFLHEAQSAGFRFPASKLEEAGIPSGAAGRMAARVRG